VQAKGHAEGCYLRESPLLQVVGCITLIFLNNAKYCKLQVSGVLQCIDSWVMLLGGRFCRPAE